MPYKGPERRIHRVFVTRNTEYHVKGSTCVGVRDRESGAWVRGHFALRRPVVGTISYAGGGALRASSGLPRIGDSMYFEDLGRDLVTSSVVSVERPRPEVVAEYAAGAN